MDARTTARYGLAGIRLVNGVVALLAPQTMARSLGAGPAQPALLHVLRMFGVRTVVLGAELLLLRDPHERDRALCVGTLIHASDALSAACAWRDGVLAPRPGLTATAISTLNVALTLVAQQPRRLPPTCRAPEGGHHA